MKIKILFLVSFILVLCIPGCAVSEAFRRDVESVGVKAGGTYDPNTGAYGGEIGTTIHLRKPEGLAK